MMAESEVLKLREELERLRGLLEEKQKELDYLIGVEEELQRA
jgi:hypothetical protein